MPRKSERLSAKSASAPPTLRRRSPIASSKSCLRTSPRWSSTPSKIEVSVVEPAAKRRKSKSGALALSLYIIGNEDDGVHMPLKIYNPNEKCRRRSPQFAGHSCGSVGKQLTVSSDLTLPHALSPSISVATYKCLRRSSRLSSATKSDGSGVILSRSVAIMGSGLKESSDLSEKRFGSEKRSRNSSGNDVTAVGEKRLRSRVVPAPVIGAALPDSPDDASSKKVKTPSGGSDVGKALEKCTRRSPRLSSSSVGVGNNDVEFDLLPLPAPSSSDKYSSKKKGAGLGRSDVDLFGEKCLRSRTIPFCLDGTENEVVKSSLIELPDLSLDTEIPGKTKITFCSSVSDMPSEKCLRPRKIPCGPVGTRLVGVKSSLVGLSDNLVKKKSPSNIKMVSCPGKLQKKEKKVSFFIGEPVPEEEARERWRWRYELKSQHSKGQSWKLNADEEDEIILNVQCHYTQAKIDGCILDIGDCAYIKGSGREKYVGRILEFFKTMEGEDYFRVQWFYRAQDTVMKDEAAFHHEKRIFYSTVANDNLLDCIVSKVTVVYISPKPGLKVNSIPSSDFYYDNEYCVDYSTFRTLLPDNSMESHDSSSPNYIGPSHTKMNTTRLEDMPSCEPYRAELRLLDLYSGCGGMSTGLCLGAKLSSVNLVTRWAVDFDKSACASLKLNHPEAQVRNESTEDFLELLKGWEKLCKRYTFCDLERTRRSRINGTRSNLNSPSDTDSKNPSRECEYEVSRLVDICYGDPDKTGKRGLKFKVHWKGYDSYEDTWEPIEGLSDCEESIQDFVKSGIKSKILPLPGDVDVICGGPPCQGISGYNRFRNIDAPLDDERNRQIVVFMDIVKFLKPKFVLMENVVDILRLNKGSLGRYALSRLVHMKYQARLGTIAAGCYGLPQFRLRVFIWGALPSEKLPQFPLPTHDVIVRYWPPPEFERNIVAYEEGQPRELEEAVILHDAISDLPAVTSHEIRDEMTYQMPPATEFQKYIRLTKYEMMGFASSGLTKTEEPMLYDHRPYQLSEDDYVRVCQIPHQKGANFRDLPGVVVGADNTAYRDQKKEQIKLPSGKPLVPDYVFTFEQGKSKRPFARLWWDETVATVVTFPSLHSQAVLHPEQDRVLTVREFARLQGFPDFYRLCGTVKERYCQVGNAVAVPVGRALGYTLGMAFLKASGNEPLMTLPPNFSCQIPSN